MSPSDFGPIYAETDLGRFPVEPWNTFSNLIFLAVVILFAYRTRLRVRKHPLIVGGLPLVLVGYVGGTLFHATRSHNLWLVMDYLPILLLILIASFYLWSVSLNHIAWAGAFMLMPLLLIRVLRYYLAAQAAVSISFGYIGLAITVIAPAAWHCYTRRGANVRYLGLSITAFGIAIACRSLDGWRILPMGTHFLWHLFGGVSTYGLMQYIYLDDLARAHKHAITDTSNC